MGLGLNTWSVLFSECRFLSPHPAVPMALAEASEESTHGAFGDGQAEMTDGCPLSTSVIFLSSPLIGPTLGPPQGAGLFLP